ncbi:DUF4252 domain-containing protein [Phocaeicola vulgatus]|nr:DUF4252 domain-containing protein [Phocaeicola vulgatus]
MKKFVFTLLLVFVCHLGYAQGINGLFNEFGSEKNADCVKVSSFMMSLGKMFAGHDEDAEIIRKIKSIKVLDLESCTASVKERFNLKSATKLFSVLLASKRPLITELADKLRLKYPLLPTISPCPTMRLEAIRSIIPISCRRYPKSV